MAKTLTAEEAQEVRWQRRLARLKKNPPAIPVALDPVTKDVVSLAYRAEDGTLGVALFKNTYVFTGAMPDHVHTYIRELTERRPDDLMENRTLPRARGSAPARRASAGAASGRPGRGAAR
jgi:hypothetical protein